MDFIWQEISFAFFRDVAGVTYSMIYWWLPIILAFVLWRLWVYYIRAYYIANDQWTLFEIKLPREILKSPKAMELALTTFHFDRDSHLIDRYWRGYQRPWASLEITSFGGEIHFFIRVPSFFKKLASSQLYAQYPEIEITEVNDYTVGVPYGEPDSDWQIWGAEFGLKKEDAYPIKTYIDYGLIDDPKEEYKVDPMTHFIEYLGSLRQGEQVWMQIMVQATKDRFLKNGAWFKKVGWKEQGETLVKELVGLKPGFSHEEKMKAVGGILPGDKTIIEAIERNIAKLGFDVGIRGMYLAKKDKFDFINIAALIGSVKQYNSLNLNGFKPINGTNRDYPWQDPFKIITTKLKKKMFDAYIKRSYFYPPYQRKPFVLNSEELATIYHFPGQVAKTPSFGRIEAKKSEPPTNLPI